MLSERKVVALIEDFGGFKLDSFDKQVSIYRTVFFLQQFGATTDYRFNWHYYGIYSPRLFEVISAFQQLLGNKVFMELAWNKITDKDREAMEKFKQFKTSLVSLLPNALDDNDKLELLSSILFICPRHLNEQKKIKINQRIEEEKSELFMKIEGDLEPYWVYLSKFGLIKV